MGRLSAWVSGGMGLKARSYWELLRVRGPAATRSTITAPIKARVKGDVAPYMRLTHAIGCGSPSDGRGFNA